MLTKIVQSSIQEPIQTIPVEQIDHINAKSQKENIQILLLINLLWNLELALLP